MCETLGLIPSREVRIQRHKDIEKKNKLWQNVTRYICPTVLGNMRKISLKIKKKSLCENHP